MYRLLGVGLCMSGLLAGAGCARFTHSEAPIASNFAATDQLKAQSAAHWNVIANDVAKRLQPGMTNKVIYVTAPSNDATPFATAFRSQLISSLVNAGVVVNKTSTGSQLTLDIDTQLVRFSADRYQNRRFYSATALAGGLWGLHGLDIYPQTNFILGSVGLAAAYDWNKWYGQEFASGPTPQYELLVTTSLTDATRYVGRSTDAYYIADRDSQIYQMAAMLIKVKGGE